MEGIVGNAIRDGKGLTSCVELDCKTLNTKTNFGCWIGGRWRCAAHTKKLDTAAGLRARAPNSVGNKKGFAKPTA